METELLTAAAVVTLAVAGSTEFIKRVFRRDYEASVIIAVSAGVGLGLGLFGVLGLTPILGVIYGLGASGLVTVAAKVNTTTR